MATDTENGFAMRHRARRAALLADAIRQRWDAMDEETKRIAELAEFGIDDAAAAMDDADWANAAAVAGISVPSQITRNMVIGFLSAPTLQGLVRE